jgi:hypothetical protein
MGAIATRNLINHLKAFHIFKHTNYNTIRLNYPGIFIKKKKQTTLIVYEKDYYSLFIRLMSFTSKS